jgi:hypothetical protein
LLNQYEILKQSFPELYKYPINFECELGWFSIISKLSAKIEKLIKETQWEEDMAPYASCVKEKYGTLRFYMSSETEEMSDLIEQASKESSVTCEYCGSQGKIRNNNNWFTTLCEECNKKTT